MLMAIFDNFAVLIAAVFHRIFFAKSLNNTNSSSNLQPLSTLDSNLHISINAKNVYITVSKSSRIRKLKVPILMSGAISSHKSGNTRGANYKRPIRRILGSASKYCALLPRRKSKLTLQLGTSEG